MNDAAPDYLTTKELAALLRLSERKVYDLASGGEVPCTRVVGKLLFPRAEVMAWIDGNRSGPETVPTPLPGIFAGSHDPLLDWALRESGSGLAAFYDGSHDGLTRVASRQAMGCGLHIRETDGWNAATVATQLANIPVVLVEFAKRQRGLIVAAGNPHGITGIADLAPISAGPTASTDTTASARPASLRFARRQESAASHRMFADLAREVGIDAAALAGPTQPMRTEGDVAAAIAEGKADVGFGIAASAAQMRLDFIPLLTERYDLLVWRAAWFDPPFQAVLQFLRSADLAARAAELGGYDLSDLGRVHFNGDAS
ncbi:helix-turn-helix transcriptional regulator [Cognatishimia sp. MH4019]|uniref:helix-turn-helix transcriptional regulator n=1 Tax=Cognatishimia sp. MH4019 TaxID=2854030 RepID=UPI001CD6F1F0|nr:helix-turn-helix transcriptional regulator [Cognatishimia sp. MH4019]